MRTAKRDDYYRRVFERPPKWRLQSLTIRTAATGEVTLPLSGRINVLCGSNGAGKTTMLESFDNLLTSVDGESVVRGSVKMANGSTAVSLMNGSEEVTLECEFKNSQYTSVDRKDSPIALYLDAATRAKQIIKVLDSQENFDELLAALEAQDLAQKQLELFQYVLNRHYMRISIYEIDEFEDVGVFPFFRVEFANQSFDSRTLGLGEHTAMLVLWELSRIDERPTVLLFEEPETHISPRSQSALIDALIMYCSIRPNLTAVITTHSANIVERIPNKNILYLVRTQDTITIQTDPSDFLLEETLGKAPRFRGILIVEDQLARTYLKEVVRMYDEELLRVFDIVVGGDHSKISKVLTHFPLVGWLRVVGVYDGDLSSDPHTLKVIDDSRHVGYFLPFHLGIEKEFIELANNNKESLALKLGIPIESLRISLSSLEGNDPHDWFRNFAAKLHFSDDRLVNCFVSLQRENERLNQQIVDFVAKIRECAKLVLTRSVGD